MNKEEAWFLGFLLSDGSITRPTYRKKGNESHIQFCIKNDDIEVLHKVKSITGTRATVKEYPDYKSPQAKICIYDRKDIIEKYSDIKTVIPEDIKGFERHFIRGIVDGDGCIYIRKRFNSVNFIIINEHKNIIEWIGRVLEKELGIEYKEPRDLKYDSIYELRYEGRIGRLIVWWLYHGDISSCCLDRKRNTYTSKILENKTTTSHDDELLKATGCSLIEDKITPNMNSRYTLKWCHYLQPLLRMKTTPMFHSKGKTKYYMLHIHSTQ